YPDEAQEDIDRFIKGTYDTDPNKKIDFSFTWHGLMGYTPNRVRRVGFEPKNHVLMYNLGCNGVGILPSVYGGERISKLLNGTENEKTIFDPE
ncbi:MAG: FAD-binding oxidoreductase, partial [Candidatus Pacebacteria bacterium]|nr:FAD-binding oxidoreductase [Candidatus Paceibacterota bacterium]